MRFVKDAIAAECIAHLPSPLQCDRAIELGELRPDHRRECIQSAPLALVVVGEPLQRARVSSDACSARFVRLEVAVLIREQESSLAGFRVAQVPSELFRLSHDLERVPDERSARAHPVDRDQSHETDDDGNDRGRSRDESPASSRGRRSVIGKIGMRHERLTLFAERAGRNGVDSLASTMVQSTEVRLAPTAPLCYSMWQREAAAQTFRGRFLFSPMRRLSSVGAADYFGERGNFTFLITFSIHSSWL